MKKVPTNFILNGIAYILLLFLVATGLLLEYVLVHGSRGGRGLMIFGLNRLAWGEIHFYISLAFLTMMLLHLFLHWSWIRATCGRFLRGQSLVMLGGMTILSLGIVLSPFFLPLQKNVEETARRGTESRFQSQESISALTEDSAAVRGYMTLTDVAQANGIEISDLIVGLNLPANTPLNEKIGPLLRSYNLEMSGVRQWIAMRTRQPISEH